MSYASYGLKHSETSNRSGSKSRFAQFKRGGSVLNSRNFGTAGETFRPRRKIFETSRQSNGKSADVHWNLALLYAHNLNRYKDAADELELYLKDAPDAENIAVIKKLIKQFREKSGGNQR